MSTEAVKKVGISEWESPTPRIVYDWAAIAAELMANPMVWAKVFDRDRTSVVNAVKQGSIGPVHPSLGFEVETRNNSRTPRRTCTLYMRFNPDKASRKGK